MLSAETHTRIAALVDARGPLLVTTDLDGTLAPIVERPGDARVPAETLAVLDRLATKLRLAVITGRDLNTARRLVPCEGVTIIGSHGLEASFDHPLLPEIDRLHLAPALESVEQRVISAVPAAFVHIERKAISTAFHFRNDPSLGPAIRKALLPLPAQLRLREGRMVYEVLPNAQGGKDRALLALANHFKAHALLAMGDDLTDVAMFRAALTLREKGEHVLLAGVGSGPETPAEIVDLADIQLESPAQARELLESLARHIGV
jgi:trehalose 6-phosphate phosphatase